MTAQLERAEEETAEEAWDRTHAPPEGKATDDDWRALMDKAHSRYRAGDQYR